MIQFDGQPWAPTRYTPPLQGGELRDSDGPRLVELLEKHWRLPDGALVRYDDWQKANFNHLLERYPHDWHVRSLAGQLRYRQAIASMGRQNGKSLIGGGLAAYGLVQHVAAPSVVGIATSVDQANVVYNRVRYAVLNDPLLSAILTASGTRGIKWRDGRGLYQVKPSKREGLQSVPVTLGIADELHLMLREMWYSIVNGQRANRDAMVIGITTAGDDTSLLLKELYQRGHAAVDNPEQDQRFGFFLWEAPDGSSIHTPGALEAANPALACERLDRATVLADIAKSPLPDQERYALNRFVAASRSWADLQLWDAAPTPDIEDPTVFAVARSSSWEWCSIVAATKVGETIHTTTVASLRDTSRDNLIALINRIRTAHPTATWAMESRTLSDVGKHLRDNDVNVWLLTLTETGNAAAGIYAHVTAETLAHDHHPVLRRQLATSKQSRRPDGSWTIIPGAGPIDLLLATWYAAYVADVAPADTPLQVF